MSADSATNLILACCGIHLEFADSTCSLRVPLTVADSATAQFNDTNVLSFVCGFHKLFCVPQIQNTVCGFRDKSDFGLLRIPLTICGFHLSGFHLQLRIPQQLNLTIQMSYHLFVDSTNCSAFRKYSCRFLKIACFLSTFERYNDLGICLWNPKQHRISEKSSNVADSATNLILACCGFHLQFADSTCTFADSTYSCGFRNSSI